MEFNTAEERAFAFTEQLTVDLAEGRAWGMKMEAFGAIARVTSLLQRPKDDDFELAYREVRYEPLWHVVCSASCVYQRQRQYRITVKGPEVKTVTIEGKEYQVSGGQILQNGVELCADQARQEVYVEGLTGKRVPTLANYFKYPASQVAPEAINTFAPQDAVVLSPTVSAATLVREVLGGLVKTVEADEILEEAAQVECVDLYFRPIYAFQFHWISKDKFGVVECDALTGEYKADGKVFKDALPEPIQIGALFDVSAEALLDYIPGGHVAVAGAPAVAKR